MWRSLALPVCAVALLAQTRPIEQAWDQLAKSEVVKVLRDDHSPYRVIYYAPVDLAKKPGS